MRESIYKEFVVYVDANDNGVSRVKDKEVTSMKAAEKTRVRIATAWLTQQANMNCI